ncbi:2-amino-4-hydroxy-6-hydroxymethyldihydropteridine diphosphokinase [Rhodopirellula sp. MGV]|uniref:2-amino-4-hydroxy-6- hydroxymethyldihydropteridine diphosphokinase n=1 Tax=Rhodopirellula sp. MGV TaxID=2023130 RepID=UPI001E47F38F|nr:2-amino-4-hydroxy-6-hydroxymethyldihydropteridine diphosphokinase [Rhodopirellula sp. MGV]
MTSPNPPYLARPLPGVSPPSHKQVSQCLISFGSNLGDRFDLIAVAAEEISRWDVISNEKPLETSRLFETPPIGGPGGQEPFLNAVGAFETTAPAREILHRLQQLEDRLGRQRRRRWDARSIDLDVVLHGRLVGGASGLVVPHPRYTARRFVLQPACDVVPHFRDPRFGWTMRELHDHLLEEAPSRARHWITVIARTDLPTTRNRTRHPVSTPARLHRHVAIERHATETAWVTDGLPGAPHQFSSRSTAKGAAASMPRLLVRLHRVEENLRWPAPHLMWPGGWQWPEYRLECSDIDWAIRELASAYDSMRCEATPVSEDGSWWFPESTE